MIISLSYISYWFIGPLMVLYNKSNCQFNRFLYVYICGETPVPFLQAQVYPCVGSSNSLCCIPLHTWKHFINPPQPATLITTVLITSNHWHLHLIRQGLQSLIVFELCVLGRKHWTEIPTACSVALSHSVAHIMCQANISDCLFIVFSSLSLSVCLQYDSENMFMSMPEPSQDFVPGNQVG